LRVRRRRGRRKGRRRTKKKYVCQWAFFSKKQNMAMLRILPLSKA
jgi:hypothetical protein